MLLEQYQRDRNVQTLVEAMHDALDFAHDKDTLKSIKLQSKQSQILTLMLRDVCDSCKFIQSYVEDSQRTPSSSASLASVTILFQ
jgi:hypothetical protein